MKSLSSDLARPLIVLAALLAFGKAPLRAEEVNVTSGLFDQPNNCPPSCPYDLGMVVHSFSISAACTNARNCSYFGVTNTAVWKVTPTLASSHGTYRVFVTKGPATDCSADIVANLTTTGGTLADASGMAQTTVLTTAFQSSNSVDCWTLVGYLTNNTNQPNLYFNYASGTLSVYSRWYMDAVRFQSVDAVTNPASLARITSFLYGNPLTIAGTGLVGHPFALVSSTNLAKPLTNWITERTDSSGTGSFSFSVDPGTASARFFRVITQ